MNVALRDDALIQVKELYGERSGEEYMPYLSQREGISL